MQTDTVCQTYGRRSNNTEEFQVYVRASDQGQIAPGRFMVIDVSEGPEALTYPVEYRDYVDLWQGKYKTDKIVLRELSDGSWAGVSQITNRQYELVTGDRPAEFKEYPTHPVEHVSWNDITGSGEYEWGFMALLRQKTGVEEFDLPDGEAWEYAARAETTGNYADYTESATLGTNSSDDLMSLAWYTANSDGTHPVGGKRPNAWGLFDFHGNVREWTMQRSGNLRRERGGSWGSGQTVLRAGSGTYRSASERNEHVGFRLFAPTGTSAGREVHGAGSPLFPLSAGLKDYNGSGIPDALEDFNGSGIPDAFEDFSGSGLPDAFEDFNGSGIPDAFEDFNGNGMPDAFEDYNNNGIPDAFETEFADTTGSGVPDFFETVRPSRIQSTSHPDARETFVQADFQASWDPDDFPATETGWLWMVHPSVETRVTLEDAYYLEPGTTGITVPDNDFGVHWFHLVPLDENFEPLPHAQVRFRFTVRMDEIVITSPTHPDQDETYFEAGFAAEWTPQNVTHVISQWLYVVDRDANTTVDFENGTRLDPETNSILLSGHGFGEHWFHLVPVNAAGEVASNRQVSYRFSVDVDSATVTSPSHPDENPGHFGAEFTAEWASDNTAELISGWRWLVDRNGKTVVRDSNSEFAAADRDTITVSGLGFGEHWFHIAPVDLGGALVPERQVSFSFMFDIDRPEITSASHPEEAYWYNDPDALFEWASDSMPPAVSAWRFRLSENEPHTGDLTDGNSQLLGADITTLDLPDRAHGRRWLTLAPVDAKGEIINQRKKSFNFNVNRKAPIVGSPSHPNQSVPGILRTVLVYWSSPGVSAGSHPFYFYVWTRDSADSPTMEDNMASTTTRAFFSQPPGSHYFHVVGVDRLGNLTEPGRFRVSIDEITGPPAGTRIPDPPVARVPASVGDNHFWAVWDHADGAQGYRLDIATDVNFENILPAYDDLDVGNVTVHHVTGLEPESTYYFRLRSYSDQGTSSHSNAVSVTTQPEFIFAHYAEYLYLVALDRYPGEGVAETWQEGYYEYFFIEGDLDIRLLPQDVGRILFDSSEYAGRGRTCEEFIDDIYRAFLFRRANDFELHVWCREAVGWNRAEVMGIIARSEESYSAITRLLPERDGGGEHPSGSRNFAAIMYVGILDRLPEHGGLDFWDGYLEAEPDKVEAAISMARSLFHSDEFLDNLPANQTEAAEATVVHMYRAFLNRWPMTPEIQFWAGELSGGRETMDSMIDFFARSDEFAEKVDQFFRD